VTVSVTETPAAARREPKPVAAVITEWRKLSHADVLLPRILEPEAWGHERPFDLKLVSVYADQFPVNDLCRYYCKKHGVPIFPTVRGAVGVGTRGVPVEGVLLIGEHGRYAKNGRGQTLYPRRRLFEEVVNAFRVLGRRVPVFNDKHLSYDWLSARWMYELARHEGIPLMAGSSLPVAWRVPPLTLPMGVELSEAFGLGYGDIEAYPFHALETMQCMTERRSGGETGVTSVRCLSGPAVWEALGSGRHARALLDAIQSARRDVEPGRQVPALTPSPTDTLYQIRYADGLEASVATLNRVGQCFAYAGRRKGSDAVDASVFALQDEGRFGHFGYLLRAVEHMIHTGRPAYPVERTLLTTGVLDAAIQSHEQGGATIPTPHLAEVRYQPADWPFAPAPLGTPA
jgi:hypothetical protein